MNIELLWGSHGLEFSWIHIIPYHSTASLWKVKWTIPESWDNRVGFIYDADTRIVGRQDQILSFCDETHIEKWQIHGMFSPSAPIIEMVVTFLSPLKPLDFL